MRFHLASCGIDDDPKSSVEELASILATVRSPSLQNVKIHQSFRLTAAFSSQKGTDRRDTTSRLFYSTVPRETLSQGLHRAMSASTFEKLASVEFSFDLGNDGRNNYDAVETVDAVSQDMLKGIQYLLAPWHDRGLVTITRR